MHKPTLILFIFSLSLFQMPQKADASYCEITGSRVNVRSGPGTNYDVICQIHKGDIVKTEGIEGKWACIYPNEKVFGWVKSPYLDKEGTVSVKKLNVRAGANENFSLICALDKGYKVSIVGEFGSWKKILLPQHARVYIHNKYVKSLPSKIRAVGKATAAEPAGKIAEVTVAASITPAAENDNQKEYISKKITVAGWLEDLGVLINRPGTYKLLEPTNRRSILYYVKEGKKSLSPYSKSYVKITGRAYYVTSWSRPVIEVEEITKKNNYENIF
ncbi:MAG: SH3 domain-containing protein [Candidatus Aureabacteria bacterium]|nr:SH3 domain-containing protein [Candidatus Auribacterota bacterium]